MTAVASASRLQILIGEDLQDWSAALGLLQIGRPPRDQSGQFRTTGKLTLLQIANLPGSMNTRTAAGAARFYRGQTVRVVELSDGTARPHDLAGLLYIVRDPSPPEPELILELGCWLTLRDFAEPDDDKSGVKPGEATERTTIVNNLLGAAGVPSLAAGNTIPAYPLNTPLQKQGGSFVGLAGKVAYGGLKGIYQDNAGQIQTTSLKLDEITPVVTIVLGRDEISYQEVSGGEHAVETVRFSGTKQDTKPVQADFVEQSEDYAPLSTIVPGASGPTCIRRTRNSEKRVGNQRVVEEWVEEPAATVDSKYQIGNPVLVLSSHTKESWVYESGGSRKLLTQRKTTDRAYSLALAEYYALSGDITGAFKTVAAEVTETDYIYDAKEIVAKVTSTKREPQGAIAPEELLATPSMNPAAPVETEVVTTSYKQRGVNAWERVITSLKSFARAFPNVFADLEQKLGLTSTGNKRGYSASGQTNPPSTENQAAETETTEEPIEGFATFEIASNPHRKRSRDFDLEVGAISVEQLHQLAEIEGGVLLGRAKAIRLQLAIPRGGYPNAPNWQFTVQDRDGSVGWFIADNVQYTHDPTRAVVGLEGIWLKTIEADGNVFYPGRRVLSMAGGVRVGGSMRIYPFALDTTLSVAGGVRVGGSMRISVSRTMTGGIRVGGNLTATFSQQPPPAQREEIYDYLSYTPTCISGNSFEGSWTIEKLNDGAAIVSATAIGESVTYRIEFTSSVYINSIDISSGQSDELPNMPGTMRIYRGETTSTLLFEHLQQLPNYWSSFNVYNEPAFNSASQVYLFVFTDAGSERISIRELEIYGYIAS